MPLFTIRITYENSAQTASFYKLKNLSKFMKKHPLHGKRTTLPLFPWLLDMAFEKVKEDNIKSKVQKIEIEERKK